MEMRIISMTDRNNELIRKYFGEDALLELQRQRGDTDMIAVTVTDMRIAASSQPCKEGVQDDRNSDRDSLVPDLLKFGKLELKSAMAAVSTGDEHYYNDCSYNEMYGKANGCYWIQVGDLMRYGGCWSKEEDNVVWRLTEIGDHFEGMKPWIFHGGGLHLNTYRTRE